jgi:hypothetical protein
MRRYILDDLSLELMLVEQELSAQQKLNLAFRKVKAQLEALEKLIKEESWKTVPVVVK